MKVRDQVIRRAALAYGYGVASIASFGGVLALVEWLSGARGGFVPLVVMMIVFPVPFVLLLMRAHCPRCRFAFQSIGLLRLKWGARRRRIDYCPHCRLALDTDVERVRPG